MMTLLEQARATNDPVTLLKLARTAHLLRSPDTERINILYFRSIEGKTRREMAYIIDEAYQ